MLEADSIRPIFEQHNVVMVVADLTTNDEDIWKELFEEIGEAGLPVNLVYSAVPGSEPITLPKVLTVSNITKAIEDMAASIK